MKVRERGIIVGQLQAGTKNCITDVADVMVGHVTLDYPLNKSGGEYACTGVTAILPHKGNMFKEKVTAASYVINGFGKTTGLVQLNELGVIESPIMLTNTFAVPAVTQGVLEYMLAENQEIGDTTGTINIVVGECNDSYLNSIRHFPVRPEHAIEAVKNASDHQALEGA
ncbi:MAG: P1 family peptidase, partial [Bacillus sp. (in: firmicutes)]